MWEHSRVPEGVQAGLKLFDLCLPPSKHSTDLLSPYVKCEVVPHGVDPTLFYPGPEPLRRPERLRILTSATNLRKGMPEVLEGFLAASQEIPCELVFKGKRAHEFVEPGAPNIFVIDEAVEDMRALYTSSDLYISGSKGEGWDLIAWEALACGVPTIVPAHTGYLEWSALAQGELYNFHQEPSKVQIFGDSGSWLVQDPQEIAKNIVMAWEDYDKYAVRAYNSARIIQQEYTWQHSALKLVQALEKHGLVLAPHNVVGNPEIHEPLVTVRSTKALESFDIGGYSIAPFKKGVVYRVPCEVARVLLDSEAAEVV